MAKAKRKINNKDLFSGSALTGVFVSALLTYVSGMDANAALKPYLTNQTISFIAAFLAFAFTHVCSYLGFFVTIKLDEIKYKRRLKAIEDLISSTNDQRTIADLRKDREFILKERASEIVKSS